MLEAMNSNGITDQFIGETIGVTKQAIQRLRTKEGVGATFNTGSKITTLYAKFKAGKIKVIPASIQIKD